MRVRIVSWNIHKGVGGLDRRYALERIVEFIAHQAPDVVLLQEVAQQWPGARNDDQVARLHRELGLPHFEFAREHQFKAGWYGNVIFSRFPLKDAHHLDLTIDWRKKRGALLARALVRQKDEAGHAHQRSLLVSNLHLGLAESERSRQLERFFAEAPFATAHHETPWVIAGDLNDLYGGLGPKHLIPRGFLRAGRQLRTFPAFAPLRPLDGIFVRGHAEVIHAGVAHGPHHTRASDHLPLVADIQLP
jgi:endonuclease/exonuclease/phosphatase family metal-dependent hydrolase